MNKIKQRLIGGLTGILLAAAIVSPLKAQERFIIDNFSQPNDTTLNYYGSGDVDTSNVVSWEDYNLMNSGIQNDMADVDGDEVTSTTPLECRVEMTPKTTDPKLLSEFYFKFLMKSSNNLVGNAQPVFWRVVNDHLKEIHKGANMMFTLDNVVDVEPKMTEERKETGSYIKTVLNDHGHVNYRLSHEGHGGHETYYIPIGAMAFLQYIVDTLSENDIEAFYNNLSWLIEEKRNNLSKNQIRRFELSALPPYSVH